MISNTNADELIQKLRGASSAEELLQVIYEAYLDDRREVGSLAELLADQHNNEAINIVLAFSSLKNSSSSGIDFFGARHIFEEVLPQLNAPIDQVMKCVLHLITEAGQDLAAGTIFQPFIDYCSSESSRPEEGLRHIESNISEHVSLTVPLLVAGSRVDFEYYFAEALRLCSNKDIEIRRRALFALGRFEYEMNSSAVRKTFNFIESAAARENDDILLANIVEVASELLRKDESLISDATCLIDNVLDKGNDISLHGASRLFGFSCKELPEPTIDVLLKHLRRVNLDHSRTLDNIDYGVAELLKGKKCEDGVQLLEDILLRSEGKINFKTFDSTIRLFLANEENLLGRIVTRWLLRGQRDLCEGITSIFEQVHGHELLISLKPEELAECEPEALIFIARKAIGYLFFQPVSAGSIVVSLMSFTSDGKTIESLSDLLFDPLLINYSGKISEYLKQQFETHDNPHVKQGIQRALESFDRYINDLRSVGDIPELYPSQENREVYRRRMSRQMSEAMKNAEKESVFLSILPKSVLLYGRKSIDYVYDPNGELRRMEMPLKSFGTEMEFPRLDNIDPFGLDYMIRIFRAEQMRDNEADN